MHNILLNDLIFALILIFMKMAVIFYFSCHAWIQSQHKLRIIWIQSQQSQAFEKMPIWVLWSIHAPRVSAPPWLWAFVCVFNAHKMALQSNIVFPQKPFSSRLVTQMQTHTVPGFQWIYEPLSKRVRGISGWQNTNWMLLPCPSSAGFRSAFPYATSTVWWVRAL